MGPDSCINAWNGLCDSCIRSCCGRCWQCEFCGVMTQVNSGCGGSMSVIHRRLCSRRSAMRRGDDSSESNIISGGRLWISERFRV